MSTVCQPLSGQRRERRAAAVLLLVCLLWAMSFPLAKNWQLAAGDCPGGGLLASLTLIGLRMPLAVGLLACWQPRLFLHATGAEYRGGALLGLVFLAGFVLQTWGLVYTTPARSAFFTCLSSAWVPLVAWAWLGQRSSALTLSGLGIGLAGCYILAGGVEALGPGELLTLIASVIFAFQVLLVDQLGRRLRAASISPGFLGTAALLGLSGALTTALLGPGLTSWANWTLGMLQNAVVLRSLICLAIFPTVLAFHWMNTYQPQVSSSRAALIYLIEPVFTSVISVGLDYEPLTRALWWGGGLILVGNLLVELPGWLRNRSVACPAAPPAESEP
jgi:drug/metabolite transporter (DMT)-like permease